VTEGEWERAWVSGLGENADVTSFMSTPRDDGIHQQALVGLKKLERYLSKWAAFRQWEVSH
jgi:hypothetical protein